MIKKPQDLLTEASLSEIGILIKFVDEKRRNSVKTAVLRAQKMTGMGWEDLVIRIIGDDTLWIGRATLSNLGILSIERACPYD